MSQTKVSHSNPAPQLGPNEHYRAIFSDCGLRYGQHYGSKSGYARANPQCEYTPNSCVYTSDRVCRWRGDIDLALEHIRRGLIDASRRLRRKLYILPEQIRDIHTVPMAWMQGAALATVWRGEVFTRKSSRQALVAMNPPPEPVIFAHHRDGSATLTLPAWARALFRLRVGDTVAIQRRKRDDVYLRFYRQDRRRQWRQLLPDGKSCWVRRPR